MDFKEEYKKETQNISPTDEQCERIRNGVMKRLSESTENSAPAKKKKPLYLKIAAVSGTAVCAAAIAIFAIAGIQKSFIKSNDMNCTEGSTNNAGGNFNAESVYGSSAMSDKQLDHNHSNAASNNAPGSKSETMSNPSYEDADSGDFGTDTKSETPGDTDGITNSDPTANAAPVLKFSEDKSTCTLTISGDTRTYRITDEVGEFSENYAVKAQSDLEDEFFVQFDENRMTVFFKDRTLLGVYFISVRE